MKDISVEAVDDSAARGATPATQLGEDGCEVNGDGFGEEFEEELWGQLVTEREQDVGERRDEKGRRERGGKCQEEG